MTDLVADISAAEARVDQLRRQLTASTCREVGCDMQSYGGMNAGCGDGCGCSIPVNVCTRCGDCDYGDNARAVTTRAECAERSAA
ncbi:hypothetical protein [Sphingomonas sp. CFBP 8764]|uniref:hypothetical protein n=1 Tax=Sphingomonas sp. CFBP 8764 TaxID=2775275 RepID=UPI001786AA85|nr:hypothetical protein [Sphingomonas sp. CFBP 8764]MBD8549872.1 hypothetical protein [Sphingomonas sp. CFBP 8764]